MPILAARWTDVGRTRSRNEDASLLFRWDLSGHAAGDPWVIAAVADGMGGHANGHVAAAITVRTLGAELARGLAALPWDQPPDEADLVGLMQDAIAACTARVNEAIAGGYGPMGSTLAVACAHGRRLLVANVGDSRVYLVHRQLQQLTEDHSLVAQLVARGELTHAEARTHPRRNEIYRMIGFGRPAEPDFFSLDLEPGDEVLLCSDGLYTMVADPEIHAAMKAPASLEQRCRSLVDQANAGGGEDNITVVALRLEAEEELPPAREAPGTPDQSAGTTLLSEEG